MNHWINVYEAIYVILSCSQPLQPLIIVLKLRRRGEQSRKFSAGVHHFPKCQEKGETFTAIKKPQSNIFPLGPLVCPRLDCSGHLLRSVTSDETRNSCPQGLLFHPFRYPPCSRLRADRKIFSDQCIFQYVTVDKLI